MRRRAMATWAAAMLLLAACGDDEGGATDEPPVPEVEQPGPAAGEALTADPEPEGTADDLEELAWELRTEAPTALTEIDAAAWRGEIWTVGGFTATAQVVPLVQIYDPATDVWREGPPLPVPVHHAAMVATDSALVVIGGYRGVRFDQVADVWVLDEAAGTWVEGPPLPAPRGAGAAAWDGSRILYGGGTTGDAEHALASEVWALTDLNGDWELVGQLSVARDHLDATSDGDGTTWFLGGRRGGLDTNLGTVDMVGGDSVEPLGELPTARGGVAAFFTERFGACLAGGEQDDADFVGTHSAVECIDAGGHVTVLPPLAIPRHGLGAEVVDEVVFVILGGPTIRLAVSGTVEALTLGG
jgi:hypothetical protein